MKRCALHRAKRVKSSCGSGWKPSASGTGGCSLMPSPAPCACGLRKTAGRYGAQPHRLRKTEEAKRCRWAFFSHLLFLSRFFDFYIDIFPNVQYNTNRAKTACGPEVLAHTFKYGGVPEWPKGADCKSVASRFGGSNPPSSTRLSLGAIRVRTLFFLPGKLPVLEAASKASIPSPKNRHVLTCRFFYNDNLEIKILKFGPSAGTYADH